MKRVTKFTSIFERTIGSLAFLGAITLAFTMLIVVYDVIMRYVLNRPSAWVSEIVAYALLYLTFLGTAWVLKEEGHIKMDLVLNRLNPGTQVWLNIITSVIGAIICLVVTWYGIKVTWDHFQEGLYYAGALELPKFITLAIIPIGTFLLFIQFLRRSYGFMGRGVTK